MWFELGGEREREARFWRFGLMARETWGRRRRRRKGAEPATPVLCSYKSWRRRSSDCIWEKEILGEFSRLFLIGILIALFRSLLCFLRFWQLEFLFLFLIFRKSNNDLEFLGGQWILFSFVAWWTIQMLFLRFLCSDLTMRRNWLLPGSCFSPLVWLSLSLWKSEKLWTLVHVWYSASTFDRFSRSFQMNEQSFQYEYRWSIVFSFPDILTIPLFYPQIRVVVLVCLNATVSQSHSFQRSWIEFQCEQKFHSVFSKKSRSFTQTRY